MDIYCEVFAARCSDGGLAYCPRVTVRSEASEHLNPYVLEDMGKEIEDVINRGIAKAQSEPLNNPHKLAGAK